MPETPENGDDASFPLSHPIRVANLVQRRETPFEITPDAEARARIAKALGALDIRKLRFAGRLRPAGKRDWVLEGQLGATVRQSCIVTLEPVTTRIDEKVVRRYIAGMALPDGGETEMPEDETREPLGAVIDPGAVMVESLALAMPLYPRADAAEHGAQVYAPEGAEPLTDEAIRPFAGLEDLKRKLEKK